MAAETAVSRALDGWLGWQKLPAALTTSSPKDAKGRFDPTAAEAMIEAMKGTALRPARLQKPLS
jgi:hypothetical protein